MPNKRRLPILSITSTGTPEFPRFQIIDDRGRYWTGNDFRSSGVVYAAYNAAAIETQEILKRHFDGVEPVRYVVPLFVEVFSDLPVSVALIARHLSRSARLYLDTPQHGHGPEGSLVLPFIDWGQIREQGHD